MSDISAVLVHVDESRHCPDRIKLAAALAQRCHATLAGFAVIPSKVSPLSSANGIETGDAVLARHRQVVSERVEEHFACLRREMPGAQCRAEELPAAGEIAAAVIREGRRADLVVLGQDTARPDGDDTLLRQVLLACGRPILIVPHGGQFTGVSKRPLIAWHESREAARAVQDALPLLRYADTVYLLEIGASDAPPDEIARRRLALAGMARYLEAHSLLVGVEYLPAPPGSDPATLIMSRAAERCADLLVMGGYGHARAGKIVPGGVTGSILSSITLPVLMSH